MIGVGGKGNDNYAGLKNENIVAICDVDANTLAKRQRVPRKRVSFAIIAACLMS